MVELILLARKSSRMLYGKCSKNTSYFEIAFLICVLVPRGCDYNAIIEAIIAKTSFVWL